MKCFRVNLVRKWFKGRKPINYEGKLVIYNNGVIIGTLTSNSPDVIYRKTYITGYRNNIIQFRIMKDGYFCYNSVPVIYILDSVDKVPTTSASISCLIWKLIEPDLITTEDISKFPSEGSAELQLKAVPEVKLASETKRIFNALKLEENKKTMLKIFNMHEDSYTKLVEGLFN